jgi:hypothetical protein
VIVSLLLAAGRRDERDHETCGSGGWPEPHLVFAYLYFASASAHLISLMLGRASRSGPHFMLDHYSLFVHHNEIGVPEILLV